MRVVVDNNSFAKRDLRVALTAADRVSSVAGFKVEGVQGYLAHKNKKTLKDHHRSLGRGLLQGPMGRVLLVSAVSL